MSMKMSECKKSVTMATSIKRKTRIATTDKLTKKKKNVSSAQKLLEIFLRFNYFNSFGFFSVFLLLV